MEVRCASVADAKAHIAKIRHDKGLSENGTVGHNVSDLENALATLSEQLYQSSTHFLLELIQNADDNSYHTDVERSMHFTYTNGYLRIDCNEVGFSPRNVEALCRVGQSTKKGGNNATRYVGEKGIGFKSVFKAADVVWISSGFYSFKFDKSKQLGMIAPIWDEFAQIVKPGFTSLLLQLTPNYNRSGLLDELHSLDSRLLIFLRRLQNIKVSISEPFSKVWERSLSRVEKKTDLVQLVENGKSCDFIVKHHHVAPMPEEAKRQGVTSSEIIFSFPIDEDHQPIRQSQHAYAFLPIRDYGFEFLIQADFLLIASREDIDDSAQWNHALRDALPTAFLSTVKEFNKGPLRYVWPRYLPIREPLQSFLKPFHRQLQSKLASQPILCSQSGYLASPNKLTYVPEKFTFIGAPMTINSSTASQYLSNSYSETDLEYLKFMKVTEMSEHLFISELTAFIKNSMVDFVAKSDAWHSHLAEMLTRLPEHMSSQLPSLKLIPLEDKSWVSADSRQILFPGKSAEFELPGGLDFAVVERKAADDLARRKLFKILGVGELEQEPVVQHIQNLHKEGSTSFKSVPASALESQIRFLYAAGWKNPACQRFWFTSESGQRMHGSQLYLDSNGPHSATKFFSGQRKRFPFVDKGYLASDGNANVWIHWLEEKMDVATTPRLIQSTKDKGFEMSEDFEFIIKKFPSRDVLLLLRDNWDEYSKYFGHEKAQEWSEGTLSNEFTSTKITKCAAELRNKLKAMLVTCKDGKRHRLDTTFIPSRELLAAAQDGVPSLDIPDADNTKWEVFEIFGVSIRVDVSVYLRALLALEGSDYRDRVESILDTIQYRCNDKDEAEIVKNFFEAKKLVYIPSMRGGKRHQWVSLNQCRWNGPPFPADSQDLRTFKCLERLYPRHSKLFCEVLDVMNTTIQDLVQEIKAVTKGDSLADLTALLHATEKMLEDAGLFADKIAVERLKMCKVFPVSKTWDTEVEKVTDLRNAYHSSEWFIADTAPLRTIFAGIVPLLDIRVDDLAPMDQLLGAMNLKCRFLSSQAKSIARTEGVVELNQELTDMFKSKADFIIRLIPTSPTHRKKRQQLITQLRSLKVYTADEVIQEWCVTYRGKFAKGPPGNGCVALDTEDDALKIYLAIKSVYEIGQTPVELIDEIFNYCGMLPHSPEHSEMCLHVALSQDNPVRIMKVFADKGIPSLESLRFADENVPKSKEDKEDENCIPEKGKLKGESLKEDSPKKKLSMLAIAGGILVFPVGIAMGVGELVKKKKRFDGKHNKDVSRRKTKAEKIASVSKEKKPKSPKPEFQPRSSSKGPHRFQVSVVKGLSCLQRMMCSPLSDEEVAFAGEFAVHKILTDTLGVNYNPRQHWTSKSRTKADLPMFSPNNEDTHSCFKFADVNGTFTQLLVDDNFPAAKNWVTQPPTYHIDVKSTTAGVGAEFTISPVQFERARELSVMVQQMKEEYGATPKNVCVLVRVYDLNTTAQDETGKGKGKESTKMVFLVDPWECYHADRLSLKHKGSLVASIV